MEIVSKIDDLAKPFINDTYSENVRSNIMRMVNFAYKCFRSESSLVSLLFIMGKYMDKMYHWP